MSDASSRHISVLGREAVEFLAPREGGVYVDATFGAGGYSRRILEIAGTRVIGIDRDRTAVAEAFDLVEHAEGRLTVVQDRFSHLAEVCAAEGAPQVDGIVMDIGVSSMQLDRAERGFSFRHDGPLDMRMGQEGASAADVVAVASEKDLANIIYIFGEERHSRAVARAIVKARQDKPIVTTKALADIVSSVIRVRPHDIHPATRTFQALRIFVNEELDELQIALHASERVLKPGGRLVVVSFHSLEDRIVKNFLASRAKQGGGSRHLPEVEQAAPSFEILTKRPVVANDNETAANPRARSAKLRAAQRTANASHHDDTAFDWPTLRTVMKGAVLRIIHFLVICALVISAAYVYRIKMDSTVRTERVLRLRADIREERNKIAALRAEWAKLSSPGRLQGLVERHLQLRPVDAHQFDSLKNLPPRPPSFIKPNDPDPIGAMIDVVSPDEATGSIPAPSSAPTASAATGGAQ